MFAYTSCEKCRSRTRSRTGLAVFTWDPSSSVVGDFVWFVDGTLVVQRRVGELLRDDAICCFKEAPVQIREPERRKRGAEYPDMSKLPALVELAVDFVVGAQLSVNLSPAEPCTSCGRSGTLSLEELGVETAEVVRVKTDSGWRMEAIRHPRRNGSGLLVRRSDLEGHDLFRVSPHFEDRVFFTDRAKAAVERRGFSNVEFLEWGAIVDD